MDPNSAQSTPHTIQPTSQPVQQIAQPKSLNCKRCNFPINDNFYFCPNCAKKLKEPPLSTGIGKQIYLYTLSVLLPPLGLWPGIKYLMDKRTSAKIIGLIAIILTILSIVITVKLTLDFIGAQQNTATNQLQQLENQGL